MGFGAKVEAGGVTAGPGAGDDGAEIGDASYGRLQSGVVAAVVDANVGAAFVGGKFDFEAGVAGGGVHDDVSAAFFSYIAAQRDGVDGDEGVGARKFGELEDEEADGAHAEYCDGIADADVAVAYCAEGEIGRVEADGGLPGDAGREFAGAFVRARRAPGGRSRGKRRFGRGGKSFTPAPTSMISPTHMLPSPLGYLTISLSCVNRWRSPS